jgi:hypothetical protein
MRGMTVLLLDESEIPQRDQLVGASVYCPRVRTHGRISMVSEVGFLMNCQNENRRVEACSWDCLVPELQKEKAS